VLWIACALGALAAFLVLGGSRRQRLVERRAAALSGGSGARSIVQAAVASPLQARLFGPLLDTLAHAGRRLTPAGSRAALDSRLEMAGIHGSGGRRAVLAALALSWAIGVGAGWAAAAIRPALGLVVGGTVVAIGLLAPRVVLDAMIRKRREIMTLELPDCLDLLLASVEAGLGFDAAVLRVVSRPTRNPSPLLEELQIYLTDLRLGRGRQDALRDLADRTGVPDLGTVTSALVQADQLGVGITAVLRAQALQIRTRRRQRAQAAALQAPVKMIFPLVFFVFPAMFIVTLGPAALRMIDTFTKVGPK
jgi:tight adherence protein C